jgi:NAD(P)-dependent dehydrogenase (short-subunit alcohol dehydrogenase family)
VDEDAHRSHITGEQTVRFDFQDRVVLVTGASGDIGRTIARMFAEAGAQLVLHYHNNREKAENTLDALPGSGHALLQADISQAAQVARLVETAIDRMGRIDVLVNTAGLYQPHPIAQVSKETWQQAWRRVIDTNLLGAAHATFCVAQHMIQQGGGRIVNVSSRGAFRGEPQGPAYGASKAGMNAMGQSLAQALAPHNIFVGTVAPGFVATERIKARLDTPEGESIRRQSPLGRVAQPEEVARTVLFLASEGTEFLTGCIVDVNGASYLRS